MKSKITKSAKGDFLKITTPKIWNLTGGFVPEIHFLGGLMEYENIKNFKARSRDYLKSILNLPILILSRIL